MIDTNTVAQLNTQQEKAVRHEGSAMVLSGAGTGKTRVIVGRIQYLIDQGCSAERIMAITFTNRAANEMRMRLGFNRSMFIGTFHSFGLSILREFHNKVGLDKSFQILDSGDQQSFIRRLLAQMNQPKVSEGGPKPRDVAKLIGGAKEGKPYQGQNHERAFFEDLLELYKVELSRMNKVDFADLLLIPNALLKQDLEVRKKVAQRYDHILIDELQDISKLQLDLLILFKTNHTNFLGVGDDDQSIYKFRGASPLQMKKFRIELANNQVILLEQNYRSTEAILNVANAIISLNFDRIAKTLTGGMPDGELPTITAYKNDQEEAEQVARQIDELVDQGTEPSSIAVLYRNHALSNLLEQQLTKHHVPFTVRGGTPFYERSEVKDVLAYLQVAALSNDLDSIFRSINNPPRKVGAVACNAISEAVEAGVPAWQYIQDSNHPGISSYHSIVEEIKNQTTVVDAVKVAIEASELRKHFEKLHEFERIENLDELINTATRYEQSDGSSDKNLASFIASCKLEVNVKTPQERITMMTIHAAKGLEFNHLFIIGLEHEIFCGWGPVDGEEHNENRRLLYVAVTRACRKLHMSFARQRLTRGELKRQSVTGYINKLSEDLFKVQGDMSTPAPQSASSSRSPYKGGYKATRPETSHTSVMGYKVGQKVVSSKFGSGVILSLTGDGDKAKAQVLFFKTRRQRLLLLAMAKLKTIS